MAYVGGIGISAVTQSLAFNNKIASRFQASSSFTANYMTVFTGSNWGSGDTGRLVIYSDNGGSPDVLLGYTPNFMGSGVAEWHSSPLIDGVSITNGSYYWLGIHASNNIDYLGASTGGTSETNSDTFIDGPSDPFGSSTSGTINIKIAASDSQIVTAESGAYLTNGGAVMQSSLGHKLLVCVSQSYLALIKGLGDHSYVADRDTFSTVHGTGGSSTYFHAAIDSSDNVHIVAACGANTGVRDIAYCIATYSAGSWTFGTWEAVLASYTETAPTNPGVAISIDSNDKPHVLFVDAVKQAGSTGDNVYYSEKTGASWATPEQVGVRSVKTDAYRWPKLSVDSANDIHTLYRKETAPVESPVYRKNTSGSWDTEDEGSLYYASDGLALAVTGTTPWIVIATSSGAIREGSDVDTTSDTTYAQKDTPSVILMSVCLVGTDEYIFYIDSSDDVHYIYNTGSGWTDGGVLQAGTYDYVIAEWAYNNENQSGEINYVYESSDAIYYDSLPLISHVLVGSAKRRKAFNQFLVR